MIFLPDDSFSDTSVYDMNNLPYMSQARSMLLIVCAVMFISASCVYMPLGYIQTDYHGKCFLYTKLTFEAEPMAKNISERKVDKPKLRLSIVNTNWGSTFYCNFTTFTPVMVAILSMIIAWSTFTVWPTMMEIGKGGVLMLVYAFLFTLCVGSTSVSTVLLVKGFKETCDMMVVGACSSLKIDEVHLKAEGEPIIVNDIGRAILIAEVASAGLIAMSCLQIFLALGTFCIIWSHVHFISVQMANSDPLLTDSRSSLYIWASRNADYKYNR